MKPYYKEYFNWINLSEDLERYSGSLWTPFEPEIGERHVT
jgi:hypothetical protein